MPFKDWTGDSQSARYEQIFHPDHPLCKEDMLWMLEFIKKKVADEDPEITSLSQPRLLKNFYYFAEIATLLLHSRLGSSPEAGRLRDWLTEASHGMHPNPAPLEAQSDKFILNFPSS
ncbi:hypothetical protein SY83_15390 [Paenibacillus swuensis]|uniref:Uncharacterized protein n=1 Tax=Paenibacillus swuensis TaxID=1178515 RepID=A0A172TK81_9BACL|nr:hypothetical protein [Paenibacillus swuensis]ANE47430.1 hypothetical protein SY83_15390 [Paenibacillus swuensis]